MFKNYWVIAVRSLRRNRGYTIINFLGLTVGMVACLLLFLLVRYETSFDGFHSKKARIYRVIGIDHNRKTDNRNSAVPFPLAGAVAASVPQVEAVAPTFQDFNEQVILDEGNGQAPKVMKENTFFVGPAFFSVFDFPAVAGDPGVLLQAPYTAMLTKSEAARFFGDWRSAVGKRLTLHQRVLVKVVGILQDPPPNTDLPFKVVVSYATLTAAGIAPTDANDWVSTNSNVNLYVLLRPGVSAAAAERPLDQLVRSHQPKEYQLSGAGLQALTEMHFDNSLAVYSGRTFSLDLVKALVWIGAFLLVIACINFINLATAQAVNRAREVGVRKVLGSGRWQLVFRFLGETAIISGLALAGSALLAVPLLQPLNVLLETQLSAAPLEEPGVMLFLFGLWAVVTVLAGIYPALVLSGFNPVTALKSKLAASSARGISLRRALVVLQFVIAQVLITGVLVMVSQMNFFRHTDLGFAREAVITVPVPGDSVSRLREQGLQQELLRNPGVTAFSYSYAAPTDNYAWFSDFRYDHRTSKTGFGASLRWADTNYFSLYHMKLAAGRLYSGAVTSDSTREFIINETCARKLGMRDPGEALGRSIDFWENQQRGVVVGVVKDFYSSSLKDSMYAVVMWNWPRTFATANIKLVPARIKETLEVVAKAWQGAFPKNYFEYQFLDDKVAGLYKEEEQLGTLYQVFAAIAIFISCLGLYGLVSFLAVQRNKEIGIRKVLGASVWQVVALLSGELTVLVLVAFVVAAPVSWYFMHRWLENYVNRIELGPGLFVLTAAAAVLIAWLAVGYRAVRAAVANPAAALKAE